MPTDETVGEFRALTFEEVGQRAASRKAEVEEAKRELRVERINALGNPDAWPRLHRAMRRAEAATVADLGDDEVEDWASKLGYGVFRRGVGRGVFMPLGRTR